MNDREQIDAKLIQIFTAECVDIHPHGGCVIHFPEIEIENENGSWRTLYDLYVKLSWTYMVDSTTNKPLDTIKTFSTSLTGMRTTLTPEDIYNNYIHSHLPSLERPEDYDDDLYIEMNFNDFCIGDDVLYQTLAELTMGFSIDKFIILLNLIDDFVRWESLEGGPYLVIEELEEGNSDFSKVSGTIASNYNEAEIASLFLSKMTEDDIKKFKFFHDIATTTITMSEEIREIWERIGLQIPAIVNASGTIYKYKEDYFRSNTSYVEMVDLAEAVNWSFGFNFQGTPISMDIKYSERDEEHGREIREHGVLVPHPGLLGNIKSELSYKLHLYLTKTSTWKLNKEQVLF